MVSTKRSASKQASKQASKRTGKRTAKPRAVKRTAGPARPAKSTPRTAKWSAQVMARSDAMDLAPGVFKLKSARAIAQSLKKSAEASTRRKAAPFRSAMSMLNFEINRAGTNLSAARVNVLNKAKQELRRLFDRPIK